MHRLWERMAEIYGHRWTSAFGDTPTATWSAGLAEFTPRQIGNGLANCLAKRLEWPPTLTEFCLLCAEVPGLPTPEAAWDEAFALAAKWKRADECSHPVIWHAYSESDIGGMSEESGKKVFLRNYQVASRMFGAGEPLREIPKALPKPQDVRPIPAANDVRDAALAKIYAMLGRRAQA